MASTISIRSWHNEIQVPRDHPWPERVQGDIEALTVHAAAALGAGLDAWVERKAGEVILIRELVFDGDIDSRCDRGDAARALAHGCARALVQAVEGGSADVLRFASRAAFIARFVEDLANGSAWGRWYYADFDGLRVLPTAAAIRTVLVDEPAIGRQALAALSPAGAAALAQVLGNDEAARILDGLVVDAGDSARFDLAPWLAVLDDVPAAATGAPPRVSALLLFASALRSGAAGSSADAVVARLLGAMVMLARSGDLGALEALLRGDVHGLARHERDLAGALAAHLAGPMGPSLRALAQRADRALRPQRAQAAEESRSESRTAPFAGLGILLDEIDQLLDIQLGVALPALDDGAPARAVAALTVIAIAAGAGRGRMVWHDTAWREFLGIEPALCWEDWLAALETAGPGAADRARDALVESACRHRRGEPIATSFRSDGKRLCCEADDSNGLWLALRWADRERAAAPESAFASASASASTSAPASAFTSAPASSPLAAPLRARLAAARRARADWRDLAGDALPASLPLEWRVVFVACAQIAWRRLAQRVPGMTNASLHYLRENLIGRGGSATRLDDDRWRWTLGRPPLHVLLSLTGMTRGSPAWRGPPECRIEWDFSV